MVFTGAMKDIDNHLWITRFDAQAEALRGRLIHRLPNASKMTLCT